MNSHVAYVSEELAQMLKACGYNWQCRMMYGQDGGIYASLDDGQDYNAKEGCTSCPTLDEARRWLREVMKYIITIDVSMPGTSCDIIYFWKIVHPHFRVGGGNPTFEECIEAAIKTCLTEILSNKK